MNNPQTIDRRDVAHQTNPISGDDHIEKDEGKVLAVPLGVKTAKLPDLGRNAAAKAVQRDTRMKRI